MIEEINMSKKKSPLTPEILIATLQRSSLNTVLFEGKDDKIVFDLIEKNIKDPFINFLPCDGRNTLLEIYKQKENITPKCLFFCDSDMWIFKTPNDITFDNSIIRTRGYSIENDLFIEGKEKVYELLNKDEQERFEFFINSIKDWFIYQVHLYINEMNYCFDKNICSDNFFKDNKILDDDYHNYNKSLIDSNIIDKLNNDTFAYIRGKYIFQAIQKIFNERNEEGKITYKTNQLFDLIARHIIGKDATSFINEHIEYIKSFFDDKQNAC